MQTFLPYIDFRQSAMCLDYRRLFKQCLEAREIIQILGGKESRWKNHPAVKMWETYQDSLKYYYRCMLKEWIHRGYNQGTLNFFPLRNYSFENPYWLGNEKFHRSHQSNLLRKKPEHYSQYFKDVPNDLPYHWPPSINKILKEKTNIRICCIECKQHPVEYLNSIGVTYKKAIPQSLRDQWWFLDCENLPNKWPNFMTKLKTEDAALI